MLSLQEINLFLPVAFFSPEKMSERTESVATPRKLKNNKPFILIISPNEDTRLLYKTLLEIWSFEVETAEDGDDFLKLTNSKLPNVILLDLTLDYKKNLATMEKFRARAVFKGVPFILLSGFTQQKFQEAAFAKGAADFLIKPIEFEILQNSLKARLNESNFYQTSGGSQ